MLITNLLIIACTIFWECEGEPPAGKLAVASVIVNRSHERNLTLVQVCTQPQQFSCWNSRKGQLPRTLPTGRAWRECLLLAQQMLDGDFLTTGKWNHYYNPALCSPSWGKLMKDVVVIGRHKFGVL